MCVVLAEKCLSRDQDVLVDCRWHARSLQTAVDERLTSHVGKDEDLEERENSRVEVGVSSGYESLGSMVGHVCWNAC